MVKKEIDETGIQDVYLKNFLDQIKISSECISVQTLKRNQKTVSPSLRETSAA